MISIDPVVSERIRRPIPEASSVLPGTLPVVSFGDPDTAMVATLSLNPSWVEFQRQSGDWLHGTDRRLASLISLGVTDPRELDDGQVAQVVTESHAYFRGPNWYKVWFHWLESLLLASGAGSYFDGSACHLDLVQWATKPARRNLSSRVWDGLVAQDRDFLHWQLANSNVSTVLMNGASVVQSAVEAELVRNLEDDVLPYLTSSGPGTMRVFRGVSEGVVFLGWNRPLAGAVSTDGRRKLNDWVGEAMKRQLGSVRRAAADDGRGAAHSETPLLDGFVPLGTTVQGVIALQRLLQGWLSQTDRPTVGDVGAFGGSPVVTIRVGPEEFVLNRDTKRAAVRAFLEAAELAGGAGALPWHVVPNSRGVVNRVSYLPDASPTPGWYAYLREPALEPRELG